VLISKRRQALHRQRTAAGPAMPGSALLGHQTPARCIVLIPVVDILYYINSGNIVYS